MTRPLRLVERTETAAPVATISLRGAVSLRTATRVAHAIRDLPATVRAAHLDLSRVRLYEVGAMNRLLDAMRTWSTRRSGVVSITSPVGW